MHFTRVLLLYCVLCHNVEKQQKIWEFCNDEKRVFMDEFWCWRLKKGSKGWERFQKHQGQGCLPLTLLSHYKGDIQNSIFSPLWIPLGLSFLSLAGTGPDANFCIDTDWSWHWQRFFSNKFDTRHQKCLPRGETVLQLLSIPPAQISSKNKNLKNLSSLTLCSFFCRNNSFLQGGMQWVIGEHHQPAVAPRGRCL